jgi:hypothetical protein
MEIYKDQARREMASDYMRISDLRYSKVLSETEYQAELAILEDRSTSRAHTLAWEQHKLAELERKSQGVPTPDAPVAVYAPNAMRGGAGGGSMYRSYQQQFNTAAGVGGGNTLNPSQMMGTSSMMGGGALNRQNYPGTVFDEPTINQ